MTFIFVRFSLQHRDIFKQEQMKAFKNSLAARRQAALLSIPCHTHHHHPSQTQPSKVTVTTRVLTHHCAVWWMLLWKTLCHPDWQRTWPLWGTGQEEFTIQEGVDSEGRTEEGRKGGGERGWFLMRGNVNRLWGQGRSPLHIQVTAALINLPKVLASPSVIKRKSWNSQSDYLLTPSMWSDYTV